MPHDPTRQTLAPSMQEAASSCCNGMTWPRPIMLEMLESGGLKRSCLLHLPFGRRLPFECKASLNLKAPAYCPGYVLACMPCKPFIIKMLVCDSCQYTLLQQCVDLAMLYGRQQAVAAYIYAKQRSPLYQLCSLMQG